MDRITIAIDYIIGAVYDIVWMAIYIIWVTVDAIPRPIDSILFTIYFIQITFLDKISYALNCIPISIVHIGVIDDFP